MPARDYERRPISMEEACEWLDDMLEFNNDPNDPIFTEEELKERERITQ